MEGLIPLLKAANSASAGLSSLAAASAAITSQSIRASVTATTTKIDLILSHNWFINYVSHIHGYYNNKNNIKRLLGVGRLRPFCWFFVFLRPFFNFSSLRLSPKKYVVLYILLFCLIVLFRFSFNLFKIFCANDFSFYSPFIFLHLSTVRVVCQRHFGLPPAKFENGFWALL